MLWGNRAQAARQQMFRDHTRQHARQVHCNSYCGGNSSGLLYDPEYPLGVAKAPLPPRAEERTRADQH